jgi:hypothetical protein
LVKPVEHGHRPVDQDDIGYVVGERIEAGRAVLGFKHVARAEPVQQRPDDPPHMGVVVDDEQTQAVEFDVNHRTSAARQSAGPRSRA